MTLLDQIKKDTAVLPRLEKILTGISPRIKKPAAADVVVVVKESLRSARPEKQRGPALSPHRTEKQREPVATAVRSKKPDLKAPKESASPAPGIPKARDARGRFVKKPPVLAPPVKSAPPARAAEKSTTGKPQKSEERQKEVREKRADVKRTGLLASAVGKAVSVAGKGWGLAQNLIGGRTGDAGDAAGLAAGGPVWSAIREIADVVDTTKDNRVAKAAFKFFGKRFKKEPEKDGRRDEKGQFLKKTARDPDVEAIVAVKTAIEATDKKETKRHKKLLKEVDGIPGGQVAEGGLFSGAGGILNAFGGGKIGGLLKGLGGKVLSMIPGAGLLAKGAGSIAKGAGGLLSKIGIGGAAKGAAGVAVKGAGGLLAKAGGKSLLKKIPGLGALAGAGFAASRLMNGDLTGAIGEMASGLASIVPGVGTAMSVAIDAGLAARDMADDTGKKLGDAMGDAAVETMDRAEAEAAKILEDREATIDRAAKRVELKWYDPRTWGKERPGEKDMNAPKPAVVDGKGLGRVSEKYESGGRGVGTVSDGRGDAGGVSYGKLQLASKTGTMQAFLNEQEGDAYRDKFKGLEPGTDVFNKVYKQVVESDPQGFADSQHAFIKRTHFDPVANYAKEKGLNVDDPAIQEALWSQSVQHGGAGNKKIIDAATARAGDGAGTEDVVNALYDARTEYASKYASAAATTDRYQKERQDVLAIARTPETADEIVLADKGIKKSLQNEPAGIQSVEQRQVAEIADRKPQTVAPVERPAPPPPATAPPNPAGQVVTKTRPGKSGGDGNIPTEFDDTLLALMAIDRV